MNFEELGNEWRVSNEAATTKEQREQLIATSCRRVERFWGDIFRRDLLESGVAVIIMIFFGRYCLTAPADHVVSKLGAGLLTCWAPFIIYKMNRTRIIQPAAPLEAPVSEFCQIEVDRLDRQIQLLRSVLWWYIVPCIAGANIMFIGQAGISIASLIYLIVTLLIAWGIYLLNQRAVSKVLVPQRNELASLRGQFGETVEVQCVEQPRAGVSNRRRLVSVSLFLAMISLLGIASAILLLREPVTYPKLAPYSGIRWEGARPVVKIEDQWFPLLAIDNIPTDDIVTFCQRTYVDKWRKRFEEDLAEVLARMGHPARTTVTLTVRSPTSSETRILKDVPMTNANRQAIYQHANRGN